MKRLLTLSFLFVASVAYAQAARPTDKFVWNMNQPGADLATVSAFRYELELDGNLLEMPLIVTCTGAEPPFECKSPIPLMNNGGHIARVRAVDVTISNNPLVSEWSETIAFNMTGKPIKPELLRIVEQ